MRAEHLRQFHDGFSGDHVAVGCELLHAVLEHGGSLALYQSSNVAVRATQHHRHHVARE